ncbi:MAG: hypothetical protein JW873_02735 [Candidatus Saganbacteria bacterium]|nr:hypothetical protein [Candidatus Saganbacteria bacterium]
MVTTVLSKVKESQSRLVLGKPVWPKIDRLGRTEAGKHIATNIAAMLTGPDCGQAVSFLRAHGVCNITVAEREENKGGLSAWFFTKKNLAAMRERFFPLSVAPGELGIIFNPLRPPRAVGLEHQCWRAYLDCVLPNFGLEINWLAKTMKSAHPDLIPLFLKQFVDLYLRLAALHAGRGEFAAADARLGLSYDLAQLDLLPGRRINDLNLTAAVAGLTLGYALPFYHRRTDAYITFSERFRDHLEAQGDRYGNLARLFDPAVQLAARCYKACFDEASGSLVTEGICAPVLALWRQAFPEQFSRV